MALFAFGVSENFGADRLRAVETAHGPADAAVE